MATVNGPLSKASPGYKKAEVYGVFQIRSWWVAIALLGLGACAHQSSTPGLVIRGKVVGPDGNPIPDVKVETMPPTDRVLTRADGIFEIVRVMPSSSSIIPGTYTLVFFKEGFVGPSERLLAEVDMGSNDVGTVSMAVDDGLRVESVEAAAEMDSGDATATGGEVGRGF